MYVRNRKGDFYGEGNGFANKPGQHTYGAACGIWLLWVFEAQGSNEGFGVFLEQADRWRRSISKQAYRPCREANRRAKIQ